MIPTSQEFHEEVQGIKPKRDRVFIESLYTTAGRQREVVGRPKPQGNIKMYYYECLECGSVIAARRVKKHKHDNFSEEPVKIREAPPLRGLQAKSISEKQYVGHRILELHVRTAKLRQEPYYRHVGVPLDEKMEPFAEEILEYARKFKPDQYIFPFVRQHGHTIVKKHLPWIYKLDRRRDNPWRHIRITHLSYEWLFKAPELRSYCGHVKDLGTLREYVAHHWMQYIGKFFERVPLRVAQVP